MLTDIKSPVESEVLVNNINNGTDDWNLSGGLLESVL